MNKLASVLTMIIIVLVGCTSQTETPATQILKNSNSTPTLENITIPSATTTLTLIPSQSPPSAIRGEVIKRCLQPGNKEVALQDIAKIGTIILGGDDANNPPNLLDLQTGNRYDLPFQAKHDLGYFFGIHASPNGKELAYIELIENNARELTGAILWVVNTKGEVITSQTITPEIPLAGFTSINSWRWLDNTRLEIYAKQTKRDGTVKIFDLSSKTWKNYSNKLPDFYNDFDISRSEWLVEYGPSLDWAVYLGNVNGNGLGPIVWDVTAQKSIWQAAGVFATINIPKWSPDGNEVAVVVNGEMYIIDRGGQVMQIPKLESGSEIMGFSWSPNGNFIALLVRYNELQIEGHLILYDVLSNQTIDYCIKGDLPNGMHAPLWSPNSQMFVYRFPVSNTPILVDIRQETVSNLLDDLEPLDWMNSAP